MAYKIGIAAGHSDHIENAKSHNYEHDICSDVEHILSELLWDIDGVEVISILELHPEYYTLPNNTALRRKVSYFNKRKVDLAIEIHLNYGANYALNLHWGKGRKESRVGKRVGNFIAAGYDQFPWAREEKGNKGSKPMDYIKIKDEDGNLVPRFLYFLAKNKAPAIITEPGSKDLHEDFFETTAWRNIYAQAIYAGILRHIWGNKTS